ncbi:(-)-germacrene D synthase-like [Prosopis cineraria]|uniref:(-)-germacrene D synthase-like n=1 Tax=Prosopis cineraria TaxID=364024 RepID=UPI00240F390D|nr:(-)-germacrene D synthase-like [Prosopis cineraria]
MSLAANSPLVASSQCPRRSANYHPSVWGDHFVQYASQSLEVTDKMEERVNILKEEVRKMLVLPTNKPAATTLMHLIDSMQRLGVSYHFELEIDSVLQQIHESYVENGAMTWEEDLHTLALLFRLLRQHGYRISPDDVFEKFKDEQGNIREGLAADVEGMLSLHEAAHLRVHGEDILDGALAFTSSHLQSMITHLNPSLASKVKHSLRHPLHKNLPRLEACYYISCYQDDPSHNETLLALAKLDFDMLQKLHQKEIGIISKWWKELDFKTKLPFARNRLVECYFWILGAYYEPCYVLARRVTTKVICIASVLDDIFDVYGTFDELKRFTAAIERWDTTCMEFLPEYMRFCYQALLDIYEEIKQEMMREGREFCVKYAVDEMKSLVQAYFVEAKWYNSSYTPTIEEYMGNALVSCGYPMVIATSFMGMGSIATEQVFQWLATDPKIIRASKIICRLMDDIVTYEDEQKRGEVASAIECYTKQYGANKEEAIEVFERQVTSAWKDINEELLDLKDLARPLLMRILNLCRVMDVLYKDADCYTDSTKSTKDQITAMLLKPFHLENGL